ncbi:surfeit locus protein 6 homolog [Styela clava]
MKVKDEDCDPIEINNYFKSVLDMIPAESYFKQNQSSENVGVKKKRSRKDKKSNMEKEVGLRARKMLAKRRKFEPDQMKTTSQRITKVSDDDFDESSSKKQKHMSQNDDVDGPSVTALRQRLKDKIAEIQLQRNPKNRSQEEIDKIRSRRKKERAKFKMKKKLKIQSVNKPTAELQGLPGQKNAAALKTITNGIHSSVNVDGRAVFNKFEFGDTGNSKKSKRNEHSAKKLTTLLAKVESKKEKLENLISSNPEEAETVMKKDTWDKALAKASGTKVKDDPELLKKSIKKEKSIKRQHAKKWKERDQSVQEKMQKKQDRRKRNIQARKDQSKNKKVSKRMKKFSKSVPGF